jgi:hypothetical protein
VRGVIRNSLLPWHIFPTSRINHHQLRVSRWGTPSTTAAAGKGNSLLDVMQIHTAYYGVALKPILEENVLWNIWLSSNLNILNQGDKSVFLIHNRKEVIDLTLGANKIGNLINNWHVSNEPSLSNHGYICFWKGNTAITRVAFRDPKGTKWESYKNDLRLNLVTMLGKICPIWDTDLADIQLQQAIILSYHRKCPGRITRSPKKVPCLE